MKERKGMLKIRDAAELVGAHGPYGPQWLRRHLQSLERRTGERYLTRTGTGTRRPTYRVSIRALRRAFPEIFRRERLDHQIRESMRQHLGEMRSEIRSARDLAEANEERILELAEAIRRRRNAATGASRS